MAQLMVLLLFFRIKSL